MATFKNFCQISQDVLLGNPWYGQAHRLVRPKSLGTPSQAWCNRVWPDAIAKSKIWFACKYKRHWLIAEIFRGVRFSLQISNIIGRSCNAFFGTSMLCSKVMLCLCRNSQVLLIRQSLACGILYNPLMSGLSAYWLPKLIIPLSCGIDVLWLTWHKCHVVYPSAEQFPAVYGRAWYLDQRVGWN
jgi:hypothetical protein